MCARIWHITGVWACPEPYRRRPTSSLFGYSTGTPPGSPQAAFGHDLRAEGSAHRYRLVDRFVPNPGRPAATDELPPADRPASSGSGRVMSVSDPSVRARGLGTVR